MATKNEKDFDPFDTDLTGDGDAPPPPEDGNDTFFVGLPDDGEPPPMDEDMSGPPPGLDDTGLSDNPFEPGGVLHADSIGETDPEAGFSGEDPEQQFSDMDGETDVVEGLYADGEVTDGENGDLAEEEQVEEAAPAKSGVRKLLAPVMGGLALVAIGLVGFEMYGDQLLGTEEDLPPPAVQTTPPVRKAGAPVAAGDAPQAAVAETAQTVVAPTAPAGRIALPPPSVGQLQTAQTAALPGLEAMPTVQAPAEGLAVFNPDSPVVTLPVLQQAPADAPAEAPIDAPVAAPEPAGLDGVNGQAATVEKQIQEVQAALEQNTADVGALREGVARIEAALANLPTLQATAPAAASEDVSNIRQQLDAQSAATSQIATALQDVLRRLDTLEKATAKAAAVKKVENTPSKKVAKPSKQEKKPEPRRVQTEKVVILTDYKVRGARRLVDGDNSPANKQAIIQTPEGLLKVRANSIIPNVGRVLEIRQENETWTVVTERGVIR